MAQDEDAGGRILRLLSEIIRRTEAGSDAAPDPLVRRAPQPPAGPSAEPPARGRARVSLSLDADLLALLKATGPGWQGRLNATLRALHDADRRAANRPAPPGGASNAKGARL